MAIVFKTPKSALNTTSKAIQNLGNGECPPCPECPEVNLETADVNYTENGEYTLTPEGDGFSKVDITVNVDTKTPYNEGYAAGEIAGIATGKAEGVAEQKAKLTSVTLTENGTSTREDGWSSVTVNVDVTTPYNNGVAAGEAAQKAKLTSLNVTSNGTYNKEDGYNSVTVAVPSDINNQNKTVDPLTSSQSISADSGYSGLGTVTVNAVTAAIDANIAAGNIKKNVSILGVTGSYDPQPTLQSKTVDPTTSIQGVQADAGYDGLSSVTVNAVTSAIDQNITANNIKSGVTILGVTGTVTEGITPTGNINITNTNSTDVTNYATAQVVDANLTAGNIKSGTTILGIQGSYDPQPSLESQTASYTANGTYTITPSTGYDGMSDVEVTVNVASSIPAGLLTGLDADTFTVEIPSGITTLRENCFYKCKGLTAVTIPNTVTTINTGAFRECASLTSITIPSSVTSIGTYAFSGSAITSITIPSSVTTIESNVFASCYSLTSITLPSSLTSLGILAFGYDSALATITIPSGVTSIGVNCFNNCTGLTEMIFEGTTPPTLSNASNSLGSTSYTFPIYVPSSAVSAYQTAWPNYASRIQANPNE